MQFVPLISSADSLITAALLVEVVFHIYQNLVGFVLMFQVEMTETLNQLEVTVLRYKKAGSHGMS
jgi:hypothetical protein